MTSSPLDTVRVAWALVQDGIPRREVAWGLVHALLPGISLTHPCPYCGGPHGPVRVHGADALASVSYAGGYAVAAVADALGGAAIGVDAVSADADGLERVLPAPGDAAAWCRVEAVLKADGRGLRVDPALVRIHSEAHDTAWTATLPDRDAVFLGRDLTGPPGLRIAVALRPR